MGKGIVVCNDTPGFLGNRVGVFAIQTALHAAFRFGLKPEEADGLFGRPMGVPKTGVFGLYDLIGIDLMSDVAGSLVSILPADDPFHAVAGEIPLMTRMISEGYLGNKVKKGGFYRLERPGDRTSKQTLDFESFEYRDFDRSKPEVVSKVEQTGDLSMLLSQNDKYGEYAWEVLSNTLCYAAMLVPDVNESLVAIDDAMKLGYNWLQGPFEMMDAIGIDKFVQRLDSEKHEIPCFLQAAVGKSFYRVADGELQYLIADGSYRDLRRDPGVTRFKEERRKLAPLMQNAAASYFELDHDIGLVEIHSKANALDTDSMHLLAEAVAHATANFRGIVIHNDAAHFSCGVNLGSILNYILNEDFSGLDRFLDHFQQTVKAMKNAPIVVVAAPSGLSLGGGFEVVLHADKVIYHANSVTGLVETLVGVVPGGGGIKEMLYRWHERKGDEANAAWETFMTIAYGKTAGSPLEAAPMAMFRAGIDDYVMNRDRLLDTAIESVLDLAPVYAPKQHIPLKMPGRELWSEMQEWLHQAHEKGQLSVHDVSVGTRVAMIVTGGDVDAGTLMAEDKLLALERKAFLELARTRETKARIHYMLEYGSPLRN